MEQNQAAIDEQLAEGKAPEWPPVLEMWIGTAADYADGQRYGVWIDATLPEEELAHHIHRAIDRTPIELSQDWGVHELRGFGGWQPSEQEGLPTVMHVARGIRAFGPAYGGLVSAVGADSVAARHDRFRQSYLGEWSSMEEFAAQVIAESGWHDRLARLPQSMQRYVRLDTEQLMRDARDELTVVEHENGVWIYDPRQW
jgi:antirestriction protein